LCFPKLGPLVVPPVPRWFHSPPINSPCLGRSLLLRLLVPEFVFIVFCRDFGVAYLGKSQSQISLLFPICPPPFLPFFSPSVMQKRASFPPANYYLPPQPHFRASSFAVSPFFLFLSDRWGTRIPVILRNPLFFFWSLSRNCFMKVTWSCLAPVFIHFFFFFFFTFSPFLRGRLEILEGRCPPAHPANAVAPRTCITHPLTLWSH